MTPTNILRAYDAVVEDVVPGERSVLARINTDSIDYYNTVISPLGGDTKAFNRGGGPVLWNHGKDVIRGCVPVARGWVKTRPAQRDIIGKALFHTDPFSDMIFDMYEKEVIRGFSINALPHEFGPPNPEEIRSRPELATCDIVYRKWTLIEFSACSLVGNPDAEALVVSRGLTIPDYIKPQCEESIARSVTTVVMPGTDRAMTDSVGGMASGGAVVDNDGHDDEAKPKKKPKPKDDGETTDDEVEKPESEDEEGTVKRYIREEDGKFIVYSEAGKELGKYDTKEEAGKRLGQIEYFKHKDEHGERSAPEPTDAEPVVPDGHGGWLARGFPGVSFPDRAIAEQAVRALANPGRSLGETLAEHDREFERRNAAIQDRLREEMERVRADFELREFGIV